MPIERRKRESFKPVGIGERQWERLVERLDRMTEVEFLPEERTTLAEGIEEVREGITFTTEIDAFKLVRTVRPKQLPPRLYYTRRRRTIASEEKRYSPTEKVSFVQLFQFNQRRQSWEEVDVSRLIGSGAKKL